MGVGYFLSLSKAATNAGLDVSEWVLLIAGGIVLIGIIGEYRLPLHHRVKLFKKLVLIDVLFEWLSDGRFCYSPVLQGMLQGRRSDGDAVCYGSRGAREKSISPLMHHCQKRGLRQEIANGRILGRTGKLKMEIPVATGGIEMPLFAEYDLKNVGHWPPPGYRQLTKGEKDMLQPVFAETLPYDKIIVGVNAMLWGGRDNSITPGIVPMFAVTVWRPDFSVASDDDKWTFIHELTHVWQTYHGNNNVSCALKIYLSNSNYDDAYSYNLDDNGRLTGYNMEQQASIVADFWFMTKGQTPKYNKETSAEASAELRAYWPFIAQLKLSGPPRDLAKYARRADSRPL